MMSAEEIQSTINQLRAGKLLIKSFPSIYSTAELNDKLNQYDKNIRILEQELERVKNNDSNRLPQCPLNERRCEFNIDDNECGRYFQCKPPKKSKSIKVKVKKSER